MDKELNDFKEPERLVYRVENDENVKDLFITAEFDELILCNLPKLEHFEFNCYAEKVTIKDCPKLRLNRTPTANTYISGCHAITNLYIDSEDCEICNCNNLEEISIDSSQNDFSHTYVVITDCKKLSKVYCEGNEEVYLDIIGCNALNEFRNESDQFPYLKIIPNNTSILRTVVCRNFSARSFQDLKKLYIGNGSIFDIVSIDSDEQYRQMVVDDYEMDVECGNFKQLETVKMANGANLCNVDFSGCCNLKNLYIGDSSHCDGYLNLTGCNISDLDLPWGNYDLNMNGCENVKQLSIPTEDFSCCNCTNLEKVDLNEETTYIPDCAFQNCRRLKAIQLPDSLETIGENAFENCSQLKEIVLPETVEKIGANAFKGCTSLERVICKNPYIEIGSKAFAECANLKEVNGLELGCILAEDAFEGCEQLPPIVFYKKAAIVGSRSFTDYETMKNFIDETCKNEHIVLSGIVSGGAKGADTYGALYAKEHNLPLTVFIPDWDKHDKKAGILRNKDIVDNSDICFAFWDGQSHGTKFTVLLAREQGKPCYVHTYGKISC